MTILLYNIALWLVVSNTPDPVAAFSHQCAEHPSKSISSSTSTTRLSALKNPFTTKDFVADEKIKPYDNLSASDERMQATIQALKQQLERQKDDVEMTELLLERLEGGGRNNDLFSTRDDRYLTNIATSLVSGVDYGFISRSEGAKVSDISGKLGIGPPSNIWKLGWEQFFRNLRAIQGEYDDEEDVEVTSEQKVLRKRLKGLTLNSTAIWEAETKNGMIQAPWIIKAPYLIICWLLDVLFEGQYVPSRFFLLETVARMPYFSYITMLHLYETLGFYRRSADVKRIHFAEEINEYRHLLIMESLGGDQQWWVRFVAQHSAIAYYVVLCLLWMASPSLSYKFSEMLETHAVHTYGQFLDENKEELEQLPPSLSAIEYYAFGAFDPFYGEFQTAALSSGGEIRRPGEDMRSLYDVFKAIRADETDHVCTMQACLDENSVLVSPSLEKKVLLGTAIVAATAAILSGGDLAGTSNLLSMNPGDMMVDGGASGLELDAIVAGAAAVVSQVFGGGSEALLDAKEVAGSVEAIEDSSVIAQFLGEGFTAGLLASKLLSSRKTKKEESEENLSDEVDVDANDENLTTDG